MAEDGLVSATPADQEGPAPVGGMHGGGDRESDTSAFLEVFCVNHTS